MASCWFAGAVQSYCGAVERGQQRLLDAQQDACVAWANAWSPAYPWSQHEFERRVDGSLLVGASMLQAQADTQRDLMLVTEKLLGEATRGVQRQLPEGWHPSWEAMRRALEVGYLSGSAMSKLSRQVGHFAATSLSATPLKLSRDVRRAVGGRGA